MPDLSDLVPFHSGQVENFYLLVLGQVQNVQSKYNFEYHILINHYKFICCIETLLILISWLLKKPADLDLHWLQESSGFILFSKE